MIDPAEVLERHDTMVARRSTWDSLWERVAQLVLPRADDFRTKHSPGDQRNLQQYDAFPMGALDRFAAAIEAGLMPRTNYWHRLSTGDEALDEDHSVKVYLEDLNERLWKARYSPRSNFASQAHEFRVSLGAFGTAVMLVEPRPNGGVRYRNIHLGETYISENNDGMVDLVHRAFCMTARACLMEFRDKTPEKIRRAAESGRMLEKFDLLHVSQPNPEWEPGKNVRPFVGAYILPETTEVIREDQHYESPYIVSRYSVSTRETYGRSPAIQLLPDISMLNEMKRTMIEAAEMAVDPPSLLHSDVSEFDLVPGAQNMGTLDDNGNPKVRPYDNRAQPGIARELMLDTRNQIDDGFLGVYFRVLLENPNMTATQAMLIAQQQGQMTAPVIGRMQSEWLGPLLRRESGILYRQGRHPAMPDRLRQHLAETREPLAIEYESPLTRAARSEEAVGILRAFETLAPIAQVDPSVYRRFKGDVVAEIVSDVNGVPTRALKSDGEMEAEDQREQAAQGLGEVLTAAPIAAETAKTLAEAQRLSQNNPQGAAA